MKKIFSYAAPLAMAMSFSVAVPTTASANNGAKGLSEFCMNYGDTIGFTSQGDCVSTFRSSDPAQTCKILSWLSDYLDLPFLYPYENQGQCIKANR